MQDSVQADEECSFQDSPNNESPDSDKFNHKFSAHYTS